MMRIDVITADIVFTTADNLGFAQVNFSEVHLSLQPLSARWAFSVPSSVQPYEL